MAKEDKKLTDLMKDLEHVMDEGEPEAPVSSSSPTVEPGELETRTIKEPPKPRPETVPEPEHPPSKPEKPRRGLSSKGGGRRWWMVGLGVALLAVGFWLGGMWGEQRQNMFLALMVIAAVPGGVFLIWQGIKKVDAAVVIVGTAKDKQIKQANCLNIYASRDSEGQVSADRLEFSEVYNPQGQPQQCLNDGKWYYVNIFDLNKKRLIPYILPDNTYIDPAEFGNVIEMPAHRKLYQQEVSLFQKASLVFMLLAFVASLIGMVATQPPS